MNKKLKEKFKEVIEKCDSLEPLRAALIQLLDEYILIPKNEAKDLYEFAGAQWLNRDKYETLHSAVQRLSEAIED